MTDLIKQLMSDKGDCRTAPATPGLLNIQKNISWISHNFFHTDCSYPIFDFVSIITLKIRLLVACKKYSQTARE